MLNEINFIHPKLLILMGRLSYETFFKSVLNKKPTVTLSNYIDHIVEIEKFSLEDGLNVYILRSCERESPRSESSSVFSRGMKANIKNN